MRPGDDGPRPRRPRPEHVLSLLGKPGSMEGVGFGVSLSRVDDHIIIVLQGESDGLQTAWRHFATQLVLEARTL